MTELRHKSNRHIVKRIIVRGTLILDTPTCLGSGDAESPTDLALLRDSISNHALLTGSSIAGALRNYLREQNKGYGESDRRYEPVALLFGDLFSYKDEQNKSEKQKIELRYKDMQSSLIIDDAISTKPIQSELRDGVKINSVTGTAADKAKYDLELLQAGTEFPLSFELLIDREADETLLLKGLAIALSGLEPKKEPNDTECQNDSQSGEISLGMKKRRGFGRCHVKEWQVWHFNLEYASDRMAWLTLDHSWLTDPPCTKSPAVDASIVEAMKKAGLPVAESWEDKRDRFLIHATFKLVGSLLIRSGQAATGRAPDVVHLKSHRPGKTDAEPILSGTSLAGVLRHRAERIVKTLGSCSPIVEHLFGFVNGKEAKSSRLVVHETVIEKATELVQNRIAIDRFTGGAYHGALFDEQPIFGGDETLVNIELELRLSDREELREKNIAEIGLLLLLLKDLWTSDLPVGGGSSIGRGRLAGKEAILIWQRSQNPKEWKISQNDGSLSVEDKKDLKNSKVKDELEDLVQKFLGYIGVEVK